MSVTSPSVRKLVLKALREPLWYSRLEELEIVARLILDDLRSLEDKVEVEDVARQILRYIHPMVRIGRTVWRLYDDETRSWVDVNRIMRESLCQMVAHQTRMNNSYKSIYDAASNDGLAPTLEILGQRSPFREYRVHADDANGHGNGNGVKREVDEFLQRYMIHCFPSGFGLDFAGKSNRRFRNKVKRFVDARLAFAQLQACVWSLFHPMEREAFAWDEDGDFTAWDNTNVGKLANHVFKALIKDTREGCLTSTRSYLARIVEMNWLPCDGREMKCLVSLHRSENDRPFSHRSFWGFAWQPHFEFYDPDSILMRLDNPVDPSGRDLLKLKMIRVLYERFQKSIDDMPHVLRGERHPRPEEVLAEQRVYEGNLDKLDAMIEELAAAKIQAATLAWRHKFVCNDGKPGVLYKVAKRSWEGALGPGGGTNASRVCEE